VTALTTQGDPKPPIKDALAAFFATDGYRVAAEVPKDWVLATSPPLVTVHDDGGPLNWPILSRNMIRVTVRAAGNPLARTIAMQASGYLHDNIPAGIADIHRTGGTAIIEAFDTDTGADLASFTVNATVRTVITV
jgi:hypothetical protein